MLNITKILTLFLALFLTGCEALPFLGPAFNIYIAWRDGEAHAYYATDAITAYNATKRALAELNYPITEDTKKSDDHYYIVADANDRFKINIVQIEPYTTKISIRINIMGDKPYAELIYKKINTQLTIIDYTTIHKNRWRLLK